MRTVKLFETTSSVKRMESDGFQVVRTYIDPEVIGRWCSRMAEGKGAHAQSALMWDIRTHPDVIRPFARFWGTNKLAVSFDGGGHRSVGDRPFVLPWHVDQDASHDANTCTSVQAILALSKVSPESGGTAFSRGSHRRHKDVVREICEGWEYLEIDDCHVDMSTIEQPKLDPGDLLMWDSRTFHKVEKPLGDEHRTVAYLSYAPRAIVPDAVAASRKKAFIDGAATTHWITRFVDRGTRRIPPPFSWPPPPPVWNLI
jgi:hypothetical protein